MTKYFPQLAAACVVAVLTTSTLIAAMALKTENEKVAYCVGLSIGHQLKNQGFQVGPEISPQILLAGLMDGANDAKPALNDKEMKEAMMSHQKQAMAKRTEEVKKMKDTNKAEGEAFLAKNKSAAGVKTTSSGLQYQVIKEGAGKSPQATDKVTVHYRGTLLNGKEFDSSYSRGEPTSFPLNQVIKGWTEGVQLMKEGAKYKFFIPSDLAYGAEGAGSDIGPNSTLIFEVELLKIN